MPAKPAVRLRREGCAVSDHWGRHVADHPVDRFVEYYNEQRPRRARGFLKPKQAFDAFDKARPGDPVAGTHFRVRTDKVDSCGKVTLRHDSKLFHIGIGRPWRGTKIRLYVADLDVRVVTFNGKLLRKFMLDPTHRYQPSALPRYMVREGSDVPRHHIGRSVGRSVGEGGFEPPTSCSQSRCAARLRYSPGFLGLTWNFAV